MRHDYPGSSSLNSLELLLQEGEHRESWGEGAGTRVSSEQNMPTTQLLITETGTATGTTKACFFSPNFFQILKSQHPTAKIHWGPSVSVICTVCQNHSHHYHPTAVLTASQGLNEQLKTCKQFQNGEYLPQIANSTHTISHLTTPGGLTLQCLNQLDQQAHERGERNSSPLAAPLCEIHWQMEHFKIKSTAKAQKQRLFCFPFTWQPYLRFLFFFNSH